MKGLLRFADITITLGLALTFIFSALISLVMAILGNADAINFFSTAIFALLGLVLFSCVTGKPRTY